MARCFTPGVRRDRTPDDAICATIQYNHDELGVSMETLRSQHGLTRREMEAALKRGRELAREVLA